MSSPRNSSRRLIDEAPLLVLPSLATILGLHEAIVLQQIHYWLQSSKHEHDGRKWLYNSYPDWALQFPFLTVNQIRRAIEHLEDRHLLLVGNYNSKGFDRTKWYSIDYDVLDSLELPATPDDPSGKFASPSGTHARRQGTHARAIGTHAPAIGIQAGPIPETNAETTTETNYRERAPRPVDIPIEAITPEAPRDMQSTGRKLTPGVNAPKPTPGTPLPRDWAFNADLRAWAIDRGLTADQADDEHDQFCAHYWSVAHDKHRGWRADWLAAEHGWFLKRDQFVPQQKGTHRDNIIPPDKLTAKLQGIAGRIATLNGADGTADDDVPRLRAYPIAR